MTEDKPSRSQKIGFGKPPVKTRFKPGKSGNPAGRPRGTRNLSSDVKRTLRARIKLKDNGKPREVSAQEALLMRLREKALKGDSRSLDRLLSYARIFNNDSEETMPDGSIAKEDQAILDAYAAEIRATTDRDSGK